MRTPRPASRKGCGPIVLAALFAAGGFARAAESPVAPPDTESAAESSTGPAVELPPVVVEKKHSVAEGENPRDSTGAVSTIPREELSRPGENLDQVLDRQAGVSAIRLGGLGDFSAASIRGSSFDQVLLFLDGIPLNAGIGGAVDLSALPPANLEKIEIYRGFAPIEATSSALGGALFLSSKAAGSNSFNARAGYGSFNTIETGLFGTFRQGTTGGFAGLDYLHSRGNFSFRNPNGTPADPTDDFRDKYRNRDFDRLDTMFKLEHAPNADTKVSLLQDFFYREGGLQKGGSFQTSVSRLQNFRSITGLQLERSRLFTGRDLLKLQAYNTFTRIQLTDPLAEVSVEPRNTVTKSHSPGGSVSYRAGAGPVDVTNFVSYRYERFSPHYRMASTFQDGLSERHEVTYGLGGEIQIPEAKLLFAPQYRFEHNSSGYRAASSSNPLNPPVAHSNDSGHSWRAGLLWKPLEGLKLRANAGRAFRFPSLYELFGDSAYVRGNPALKPEKGFSYDAGFEGCYGDDNLWISGGSGFFYQDAKNLIQFARSTVFSQAENAGNAIIKGVESSLTAGAWKTVRFYGSHTWLDTHIYSSSNPARAGKKSPNHPPNQWTMKGTVYRDRMAGWADHAEIWTELDFTASHFIDGANLTTSPARQILGIGAELRTFGDRLTITLEAKNLTDEEVIDVVGFPLPGRTFFGRLEWRFI